MIDDEEGGDGRALGGATGVQNSTAELEIDTQFNQAGFYGTSASVGIWELSACGVWEPHRAFSQARVIHTDTIPTCSTISDCYLRCNDKFKNNSACVNGGCYDRHTSQVASVISSTNTTGPWNAARATLVYANKSTTKGSCDVSRIVGAYSSFLSSEGPPRVGNESFYCGSHIPGDPEVVTDGYTVGAHAS